MILSERIGVVPNQSSAVDPGSIRLAIIGESPGLEEVHWCVCRQGHGFALKHWQAGAQLTRDRCPVCGSSEWTFKPQPFCGPSGRLLNDLLAEAGLPRERCFVGNCARVSLNDSEKSLDNPAVQSGLTRLAYDLEEFRPNCLLLLGNLALSAFHARGAVARVTDYRGSIFESARYDAPAKCVAALHPAAVLREPSQLALLRFDIQRAVQEAGSPTLDLPTRAYSVHVPFDEVLERLIRLRQQATVACDLEGSVETGVLVIGFATSATDAFTVPFKRVDFSAVWTPEQTTVLWNAVRDVLEDQRVCKVFHNAAYDLFVLAWLHGITVRNVADTMIQWACAYPELDKALDVVASVLTRGEYWKHGLEADNDHDRDAYCCEDCCRTFECHEAMERLLEPGQRAYYQTQVALLEPVLAMMLGGIRYDRDARDAMLAQVQREIYEAQGELDTLAGIAPPSFEEVAEAVTFKRSRDKVKTWDDVLLHAKPSYKEPL